jgi:inositol 1,4,5-triphosphate receptor type 1
MSEEETSLKSVTFGSTIYLSTESSLDSYMFTDGFMDNTVRLKSFQSITGPGDNKHHDFSFCLFMVLPFVNESAFEVQNKLIGSWR